MLPRMVIIDGDYRSPIMVCPTDRAGGRNEGFARQQHLGYLTNLACNDCTANGCAGCPLADYISEAYRANGATA